MMRLLGAYKGRIAILLESNKTSEKKINITKQYFLIFRIK
jgi:hypothetical protein